MKACLISRVTQQESKYLAKILLQLKNKSTKKPITKKWEKQQITQLMKCSKMSSSRNSQRKILKKVPLPLRRSSLVFLRRQEKCLDREQVGYGVNKKPKIWPKRKQRNKQRTRLRYEAYFD